MEIELFSLIAREDLPNLSELLEAAAFDPFTIKDSKQSNLLHIAALKNSVAIVSLLVDLAQRKFPDSLHKCLHERNSDGFTCLLYAAYKGNLVNFTQTLVDLFVTHGASFEAVTNIGVSFMHAAAQGNHLAVLIYGYQAGLSPMVLDSRRATPLHWAAHLNCCVAASYLLSITSEVNAVDTLGQTPLHVATAQGHVHIVRLLLLKGASPTIRDDRGRRPLDVAVENNFAALVEVLHEPNLLNYCGIRLPQRPVSQRPKSAILFLMLVLVILGLDVAFVLPYELWYYILAGVHLILFAGVAFSNPGKLKMTTGTTLLMLAQTYEASSICVDCVVARPRRAVHCTLCNACVTRFDHHCPLTNNCIGGRNFGLYIAYLVVGLAFFAASAWLNYVASPDYCAAWLQVSTVVCGSLSVSLLLLCGLCGLFFAWLVLTHSSSLVTSRTYYERVYEANTIPPTSGISGCFGMCCHSEELRAPLLPREPA